MTSRFVSNLTVLLAGAFLVAASLGFGTIVLGWLGLATGAIVLATVLVAFACRGRGIAQRGLDAPMALAGAWAIVASRSFAGVTLKWLTLAEGAVMVLLAFAALIVHEALLELAVRRARDDARRSRVAQEDLGATRIDGGGHRPRVDEMGRSVPTAHL